MMMTIFNGGVDVDLSNQGTERTDATNNKEGTVSFDLVDSEVGDIKLLLKLLRDLEK